MSTPPVQIDATAMGQLIASTPAILGFQTTESIVVLATGDAPYAHVGIRADLPEPDAPRHHHDQLAQQLATATVTNAAQNVCAWIISSRSAGDQADLVTAIRSAFKDTTVEVGHIGWVTAIEPNVTWSCLQHRDCGGILPDPKTVPLAAAAAYAGLPTHAHRDELKSLLTPVPEDQIAHVAGLLAEAASLPVDQSVAWRLVVDALEHAATSPNLPELDHDTIVALAVALSDPDVRNRYQTVALDSRAGERLMTALTRTTPCPERATPAALLAAHHYLSGDGTRANIALEVAVDADPDNVFARLLGRMLDAGLPPHQLRAAIRSLSQPGDESNPL